MLQVVTTGPRMVSVGEWEKCVIEMPRHPSSDLSRGCFLSNDTYTNRALPSITDGDFN